MNEQLKNLVWELDRRIWASVTNGEATASWGRQESAKMIEEYASEQNAQLRKELELCQTGNADLRLECELLRKEIEEYKVVVKNYDKIGSEKTETITSLRELLRRSKDYIFLGYVGATELSDDIDNALNHKP